MNKLHHPFHLYFDDQFYFLTAHTYLDQYRILGKYPKLKLLEKIRCFFKQFKFILHAWVILDNHYHLLFKTSHGRDLARLIGKIHAGYSVEMNRMENRMGRKIWQGYWDWCIRSEKDFCVHFNYIHHNPIKHRYAQKMVDYGFSSYRYWLDKKGEDWMTSIFQDYPVIDFTVANDDFSNERLTPEIQ
jgi:putative transposase